MTALAEFDLDRRSPQGGLALAEAGGEGYRAAMRQLAGGVCLVTHATDGTRVGLTATSVASLTLDPPTLIVCLNRASSTYSGLAKGAVFGVSVLGADHSALADRFLKGARIAARERRDGGDWVAPASGVPLLAEAAAAFDCQLDDILESHGCAIVVGRVRAARASGKSSALVSWRGAYNPLGWTDDEISRAVGLTPVRPGVTPN